MPRPFVILFEEKEGSTAMVQLLDNFDGVDVVRDASGRGWEPFDDYLCGPMRLRDFGECLDLLFGAGEPDHERLQELYRRTARGELGRVTAGHAVGFKMRLRAHRFADVRFVGPLLARRVRRTLLRAVRRHGAVVFLAVRQDVYRWALSKYHGDGSGRDGHLQFELAKGRITREQIPKIEVDLARLDRLIRRCERTVHRKQRLFSRLERGGIDVHWLRYEDFCRDPAELFGGLLTQIDVAVDGSQIGQALAAGSTVKKVHADDIRSFVVNHEEVEARFGSRFVAV